MNRRLVTVALAGRSYPIHLGRDLLGSQDLYPPSLLAGRGIIVSNETVAPLYLDRVQRALPRALPTHLLPDGEKYKSLQQLEAVLETMLRLRLGRDAVVIALGGGVIGDLAGLAAALYQRGVGLVQIPTTLLAQVDSSVGGKTAVNHPLGKNMIGAFHQPLAVITDLATLDTLPQREYLAGMAEIIKYGLIGDAAFADWLWTNRSGLLSRDHSLLADAIERSCQHKARVVAADETEQGQRALLNLGHSFGHAIESHLRYEDWLHGEAVAAGMCLAADLSWRHGWLNEAKRDQIIRLVEAYSLPTQPPAGLAAARMLDLMQGDKKAAAGRVRLVLLREIGNAFLTGDYQDEQLMATLTSHTVE